MKCGYVADYLTRHRQPFFDHQTRQEFARLRLPVEGDAHVAGGAFDNREEGRAASIRRDTEDRMIGNTMLRASQISFMIRAWHVVVANKKSSRYCLIFIGGAAVASCQSAWTQAEAC